MGKFRQRLSKFGLWAGFVFMIVLWLGVFILPSAFEKTEFKTDGEWIKVRKGTVVCSRMGQEDFSTPLNAGDSVRLLGYRYADLSSGCLVETSAGERGEIQMWMLDIPMLASGGRYSGDTVRLSAPSKLTSVEGRKILTREGSITGVLPNGEKTENLVRDNFYPDVPDVFHLKLNDMSGFTTLMSKGKFEKRMKDLRLRDAERKIGPVYFQGVRGNGEIVAAFRTHVFDPSDGKFYRPIVTFSADSIAVSGRYQLTGANSDYILRYIPGASFFFNLPATAFFARSDIYNPLVNPTGYVSEFQNVLYWVMWSLRMICFVIWIFCFGFIPLRVIDFIVEHCPKVFGFVSNTAMNVIYWCWLLTSYYFWLMVTLAWGMYWLVVIVEMIVYFFIIACCIIYFTNKFWNFIPHTRCPECKHIGTIELVRRDFKGSEIGVRDATDTTTIGKDQKRWKEYDEVHYASGRVEIKNEEIHTETTIHERHDKFKEKVRHDKYAACYRCTVCGHTEGTMETDTTLLSRLYKGSKKTSRTETDVEYK